MLKYLSVFVCIVIVFTIPKELQAQVDFTITPIDVCSSTHGYLEFRYRIENVGNEPVIIKCIEHRTMVQDDHHSLFSLNEGVYVDKYGITIGSLCRSYVMRPGDIWSSTIDVTGYNNTGYKYEKMKPGTYRMTYSIEYKELDEQAYKTLTSESVFDIFPPTDEDRRIISIARAIADAKELNDEYHIKGESISASLQQKVFSSLEKVSNRGVLYRSLAIMGRKKLAGSEDLSTKLSLLKEILPQEFCYRWEVTVGIIIADSQSSKKILDLVEEEARRSTGKKKEWLEILLGYRE